MKTHWWPLLLALVLLAAFYSVTAADSLWLRDWTTLKIGVE